MRKDIQEYLTEATDLSAIGHRLVEFLRCLKSQGNPKIGYVAGMITSEGPEFVERNLLRLEKYTQQISKKYHFPVFSQNDIFTPEVYQLIKASGVTREEFEEFYRQVHGSGLITHLFMTPRWELSRGATDELNTAVMANLTIIYIE
ncbi:hypothetical protein HYV64_01275 [Candidatus Shapirobacteria bacterium]|nr:hypothetical protein [Candidatus Shapirobacteria bacterium]